MTVLNNADEIARHIRLEETESEIVITMASVANRMPSSLAYAAMVGLLAGFNVKVMQESQLTANIDTIHNLSRNDIDSAYQTLVDAFRKIVELRVAHRVDSMQT